MESLSPIRIIHIISICICAYSKNIFAHTRIGTVLMLQRSVLLTFRHASRMCAVKTGHVCVFVRIYIFFLNVQLSIFMAVLDVKQMSSL